MTDIVETEKLIDDAFNDAMATMRDFIKRNRELGPMALITLARAVGLLTVLTSSKDDRADAIGTIINEMTDLMLDGMEAESEMDCAQ